MWYSVRSTAHAPRGLRHDEVLRIVGDGATRGNRQEPRTPPTADNAIDLIAMEERAFPPAPSRDAFGEHVDDGVKIVPRQLAIGVRAAHEVVQIVLAPGLARRHRDHLLREEVERPLR